MSTHEATKNFTLRGITVQCGQMIPDKWPPNLIRRLELHRLVRRSAAPSAPLPAPTLSSPAPEPEIIFTPDPEPGTVENACVMVLSRYTDIFYPLRDQLNHWEPAARKILVTSGPEKFTAPGWDIIPGIEPFCFGKNANVGIRSAGDSDILLLNDDVRLRGPVLRNLKDISHAHPEVGILAPQVQGGCGNLEQKVGCHISGDVAFPKDRLAFIAIYIKRSTLASIGLFDERFNGYGSEDTDFCMRVERARLKSAITSRVMVLHGHGKHSSSSSFLRVMTYAKQRDSMALMRKILKDKWAGVQ